MKLAIVGSFGFRDIGDEAMLTENLAFLRRDLGVLADAIFLFGDDPDYLAAYHQHPRSQCYSSIWLHPHFGPRAFGFRPTWRWLRRKFGAEGRAARRAFDDCQRLLVTGGGTINTRDRGVSLRRMHALLTRFHRAGEKPVFLSGQTIGPLGLDSEHDRLAREIVACSDVLTVRDPQSSRSFLEGIGAEPKVFLETCDDACTLSSADVDLPQEVSEWLSSDRATIAFNLTEYTSATKKQMVLNQDLLNALLSFDHGTAQLLLLAHTPLDFERLTRLYTQLGPAERDRVLLPDTRDWRGEHLKRALDGCRLAIGGRYHFVVFAAMAGTRFLGLCGNHYSFVKQNGFAQIFGWEDAILNVDQAANRDTILQRARESWDGAAPQPPLMKRPSASMKLLAEWLRRGT